MIAATESSERLMHTEDKARKTRIYDFHQTLHVNGVKAVSCDIHDYLDALSCDICHQPSLFTWRYFSAPNAKPYVQGATQDRMLIQRRDGTVADWLKGNASTNHSFLHHAMRRITCPTDHEPRPDPEPPPHSWS